MIAYMQCLPRIALRILKITPVRRSKIRSIHYCDDPGKRIHSPRLVMIEAEKCHLAAHGGQQPLQLTYIAFPDSAFAQAVV
ncbi:hypothetical protein D3C87_1823360 [compost metagenome]